MKYGKIIGGLRGGLKSENGIRVVKNFMSLLTLQGLNYLLPLVTVPYLTRVLGPANYGMIGFAGSFINYFSILTDYGFNLSATRDISINREDRDKINRIVSAVLAVKFILMLLSFIILLTVIFFVPRFRNDLSLYLITFGNVVGGLLTPVWFFQGIEDMKYITNINVIMRLVSTALIFLVVTGKQDYINLAVLNSLSAVAIGIICMAFMLGRFKIKLFVPGRAELASQLKEGWHVFVSSLSIVLYTSSTTFVLGLMTNNTIVGYYVGADKIRQAVQGLFTPAFQAVYPYVNNLAKNSREKALAFIKKELLVMGVLGVIISAITLVEARLLVGILLGKDYREAVPLLEIMAFLPFIIAVANVLTVQCLLAFDMKKEYLRIYFSTSIIGMFLIISLTYFYHQAGTAWSVLLIEAVVVVLTLVKLRSNNIIMSKRVRVNA